MANGMTLAKIITWRRDGTRGKESSVRRRVRRGCGWRRVVAALLQLWWFRVEVKKNNRNTSSEKRLCVGEEKDGGKMESEGWCRDTKGESYDLFKVVQREIHYTFFFFSFFFLALHFLNDCTLIFIQDLRQNAHTHSFLPRPSPWLDPRDPSSHPLLDLISSSPTRAVCLCDKMVHRVNRTFNGEISRFATALPGWTPLHIKPKRSL